MKVTTRLNLGPRFRMTGAITPRLLCALLAWTATNLPIQFHISDVLYNTPVKQAAMRCHLYLLAALSCSGYLDISNTVTSLKTFLTMREFPIHDIVRSGEYRCFEMTHYLHPQCRKQKQYICPKRLCTLSRCSVLF